MYHRFGGEDKVLNRRELIKKLEKETVEIRKDILKMIYEAGKGHPGGSFSAAEVVTALYFTVLNIDPGRPDWPERDRFILSKGHACPVWYAALARRGFFDKDHLLTLRKNNSILQGHPDMNKTPGVDMNTGSLGNGLSIGLGIALSAGHYDYDYDVYVVLGDGEIQEGMVWEAAMSAGNRDVDNLYAVVDYNGLQNDGYVKDINNLEPIIDKWKAFNWKVKEIDGHNMNEILNGFEWMQKVGGPAVLISHTVKGKGVSYMENICEWHGNVPDKKQLEQAMVELENGGGE
ncbi:MAG: transketolase [Halanaerobiaceae bacterium]